MYAPPGKKLNKAFIIDKIDYNKADTGNCKMPTEQHKLVLQRNISQLRFELSRPKAR